MDLATITPAGPGSVPGDILWIVGRSAAAPFPSVLAPGYRLDRYELLGPLAEGGMASVWIARQRGKHGFEKLVALKTILPQYAADLRFQQMFLDEARIASRIEHFNVARILDLGEEHDVLYLAMEYVDGDALSKLRRAWQKQGTTPPAGVILRILADACSGLHEAHELRGDDGKSLDIVHRDVSPHNILVSIKGVTKLIDFGIAKARDRLASETNAGVLKGKIQYMAPEQALGRPVDRRADIWAIGASLYHLLTGKPAYEADNTLGTLHLLTSGRPPLPMPPSIHTSVANIARKALTTAPDRRFSTAAEMRDAIEAAMLDAKIPTSAGEVAAYALDLLSERTAKRRQVIDIALAAAAERERVEEILKPSIDRTGSGVTSAPSVRTAADAPGAMRAAPLQSIPPPSERPTALEPSHYLGMSPSVERSPSMELLVPRSRAPLVVSFLVGGALVAGGVAFATMRSHASPAQSTSVVAAAAAPPVAAVPAEPTTANATSVPSAASSAGGIPIFSADSLPKAGAAAQAPAAAPARARPVTVAPSPRAAPPPTATTSPPRRKSVDDGF
jgi:eukaryotic-like serine/threonine-protein kinase